MESHWAQYFLQLEGQAASCVIDLGYGEVGPDEERPVCTLLRVPLAMPGDDGMGEEAEIERLRAFEDRYLVETAGKLALVLVATVRGGGQLDFWFYGPTDRAEELLDAAAAVLEGYEVQGGAQEDPEWEQYFDVLFPDREGLRQIADQGVLIALMDAGDDGHVPRPIEHVAVFATREAADDFAAKVSDEGFRLDGVAERPRDGEDEAAGEPEWLVEFCNESPADLSSIVPVTSHLEALAEECGGQYDGWQTAVVKE